MTDHPHDLDKIDLRILRVLQADGRISNLTLADEVHLSATAVLERVKRLTRDGYILGYEARRAVLTICSRPAWPTWRPTASSSAA